MVIKILCILVLWTTVASTLEGLRVSSEVVVWIYDTFGNNFEIENGFTNYLKESCRLSSD